MTGLILEGGEHLTDCESGQPAYIERRSVGREDFMTKVLAGSNRQGLQLNFK
jgi:hypothetical protein